MASAPLAPIVPKLVMVPASVMVPPERATTVAPDSFVRPPVSDTCAPDPLASISPKLSMLPAAIIVPLAVAWIRPKLVTLSKMCSVPPAAAVIRPELLTGFPVSMMRSPESPATSGVASIVPLEPLTKVNAPSP